MVGSGPPVIYTFQYLRGESVPVDSSSGREVFLFTEMEWCYS